MAKVQTSCPRCRQPIIADVEQLFDMNTNPQAKQMLLGGGVNTASCPNCGYQGMLSTPIVYHDPEKELLLTFFPSEMGLPVNEQEKMIGPLITRVVNALPVEKRKAYLFQPRTMLTFQTMVETILEKDGITKEMLDAQQKKLNLLQRLLGASQESRAEIIRQENDLIDQGFFTLISRLVEATLSQGDEQTARALAALQQELLNTTEAGKALKAQAEDAEAALKALQAAGKDGLTREKLVDLITGATSDVQLTTLVSYTRAGMDYEFFQLLSSRIDSASGAEKERLLALREKLLKLTEDIDKVMQARIKQMRDLIEELLKQPDLDAAAAQIAPMVDEVFVQLVQDEIAAARKKADLERSARLQSILAAIEKASAPPPEVAFIEELLQAESDEARAALLDQKSELVTENFLSMLNNLVARTAEDEQAKEMNQQLQQLYRQVLRRQMASNLKG